ncbi:hypothetical protein ACFYZJ_28745 [Streptomyces sp. NPDC001848]|uniref:hypothetical protein n=1 Tax=Streptomyces sp. NPDC001848 TaxID=3364618 RepID=UPI0036819142
MVTPAAGLFAGTGPALAAPTSQVTPAADTYADRTRSGLWSSIRVPMRAAFHQTRVIR